ncbi:MAG TPA: hypothetical protein VG125_29580 [Pirellulales bacterium]|jgi:hypothetical protein|nr:hypothetical protein [Pirellulales bacterium]
MAKRKKKLTIALLCEEAGRFSEVESTYPEPTLFGVTDGKAIGTYLEHKLLVFVYEKKDDSETRTAILNILHTIFVEPHRTADYTMTALIRKHLETGCNAEDLIGLMHDKNLPVDGIEANAIAEDLLRTPCEQGYLTISNALQWRLQYGRIIGEAGKVDGIRKLR